MKILLSAYACEPYKGSEPGVGWHWAVELARIEYQVWVITRANNQPLIERALKLSPMPNLHFVYYDLPAWARWWKKAGGGVYLYYLLWQWGAYRLAKSLTKQVKFDLVHHITFGVFRQPSFMPFLGIPFIFGPLGGGERVSYLLRKSFPLRGYVIDVMRDLSNWLASIDPLNRSVYRHSTLILCKTEQTLSSIPKKYRDKCRLYLEIGIEPASTNSQQHFHGESEPHGLRVLYVGRLIYWKGLHLGLKAFAQLYQKQPEARLTVIGSGPEQNWLNSLAEKLDLSTAIDWIPWMEQEQVLQAYSSHDIFLFPSLHDSSGNVILEALSQGLPVVCLDLGGPGVMVNESCGRVVKTKGLSETAVIQELSNALQELAGNAELPIQLRQGALIRSQDYQWDKLVSHLYSDLIEKNKYCKNS